MVPNLFHTFPTRWLLSKRLSGTNFVFRYKKIYVLCLVIDGGLRGFLKSYYFFVDHNIKSFMARRSHRRTSKLPVREGQRTKFLNYGKNIKRRSITLPVDHFERKSNKKGRIVTLAIAYSGRNKKHTKIVANVSSSRRRSSRRRSSRRSSYRHRRSTRHRSRH